MLDRFREWLSDNLRYILLGLAIIILAVIAFLAVKLIRNFADGGSSAPPTTEAVSSQDVQPGGETEQNGQETTAPTETEAETEKSNDLVKDDPAVLQLVQSYYTAVQNKDMETLQTIADMDEEKQQGIEAITYIESYNNVSTYSKAGLESGSYVVYVYYEAKVTGVETMVPSLNRIYVCTNASGSLYVADKDGDQAVQDYIAQVDADADVQALVTDVKQQCDAAEARDADLKRFMDDIAVPETEYVIPEANSVDVSSNRIVQAITTVNVRADSTEDADIIGTLYEGDQVTRVQALDNGWSEVRYGTQTAYVKSEFLTEVQE